MQRAECNQKEGGSESTKGDQATADWSQRDRGHAAAGGEQLSHKPAGQGLAPTRRLGG